MVNDKNVSNLQLSGNDPNDECYSKLLRDEETGSNGTTGPPSFVGQFEALQYQMNRLEGKIEQLDKLQKLHVNRPTLDETNQEELDIKHLTSEVSEVHCKIRKIHWHNLAASIFIFHT